MTSDIAAILRTYIETLPFKDKVGGLVKAITFMQEGEEGLRGIKKVMPVDCGVTHRECTAGKYTDLMPNNKYKSVMYFEDGGTNIITRDPGTFSFETKLTLVVWLNLKKLGKTGCSVSALAIGSILKAFPTKYVNSSPYTRIQISVDSQEPKTSAIFSKYTYDEEKLQYLMYPFDYFALNISVKFTIPESCITDWENDPELLCDESTE